MSHVGAATRLVLAGLLLLTAGCNGDREAPDGGGRAVPAAEIERVDWSAESPSVLDQAARGTVLLARHPEGVASVSVPRSSRPGAVPDRLRLRGFEPDREDAHRIAYSTSLPVLAHHYADESRDRPPHMRIFDAGGTELPFERERDSAIGTPMSWGYRPGRIVVRAPVGRPPPEGLGLEFPMAAAAERSLSRVTSGLTGVDFVHRTLSTRTDRRTGIFLPAPGSVRYRIKPGEDGVLRSRVRLLPPAFQDGGSSHGAGVVVSVSDDERTQEEARLSLDPGGLAELEVDLSRYAGREVTLQLATTPGEDADFDYVFFEEPALQRESARPRRLLVLFIDTLRRDHLGAYGYERPVSPLLDELAAHSVVFDDAWAPSPWTLPSARAAYSGLLPHRFDEARHVGRVLARAGWTTLSLVSNNYLSEQFDLHEGWSVYRGSRGLSAPRQVSRAIEHLEEYPRRDVALFLHLIDPHLPYGDDPATRGTFATVSPPGFRGVVREDALEAAWAERPEEREQLRQYTVDLYDEQILLVDEQLDRLLAAFGEDAVVVVFSDHGEELFEEGELGHGHSLSDAQLRVPVLVRAPGLKPHRVSEAVSLVDLGATLLELGGARPPGGLDGRSLMPLLRGEPLAPAPVVLGWNLFRAERWGLVHDGRKWVVGGGREQLEPLREPGAAADPQPWRDAFSRSTGLPLRWAWRVVSPGRTTLWRPPDSSFELTTPVGIETVWSRLDFYGDRADATRTTSGFRIRSARSRRAAAESWAVPGRPSTRGLTVRLTAGGSSEERVVERDVPPSTGASITRVGRIRLDWALVPVRAGGSSPRAVDAATRRQLRALGYVDEGQD